MGAGENEREILALHFSGSKPTLAIVVRPTLAKVKVFSCMKRFWFLGVNCLGFLKLIVWSWVGGEGGAPWTQEVGGSKPGAPKGGAPKGGEGPKFLFTLPPHTGVQTTTR